MFSSKPKDNAPVVPPLAALTQMYDIIEQVELKDWRREGEHVTPAPIGAGEAVVWPIVEALALADYTGWVTLHHLKQHHPALGDLDEAVSATVRSVVARVRGGAHPSPPGAIAAPSG